MKEVEYQWDTNLLLNEGLWRIADGTATYHREGGPHSANLDDGHWKGIERM
jgi:hypothetical protein